MRGVHVLAKMSGFIHLGGQQDVPRWMKRGSDRCLSHTSLEELAWSIDRALASPPGEP